MMHKFSLRVDTSIYLKILQLFLNYHFISTLLNANFVLDVSVAIDLAKCVLPGKKRFRGHLVRKCDP